MSEPAATTTTTASTPDMTAAEAMALEGPLKLELQSLPAREYLESTVVPLLLQGMNALVKERPQSPIEYLAVYLLEHGPAK
jgi:protein dpy-30